MLPPCSNTLEITVRLILDAAPPDSLSEVQLAVALSSVKNASAQEFHGIRDILRSDARPKAELLLVRLCTARAGEGDKTQPYFSRKREPGVNLNGLVTMPDDASMQIACRHLANRWAVCFLEAPAGRIDYNEFDTPAAIHRGISRQAEADVDMRRMNSTCHLAGNHEWGRVISDTFRTMAGNKETCRSLLIYTTGHALALGLKLRDRNDRQQCILKFYDPNMTVTHQRVCGDLGEIDKLRAEDFLTPSRMKMYDLPVNGTVAFIGEPIAPGANRASRVPGGPLQPQTVYQLMVFALAEQLLECTRRPGMNQQNILPLLAAKNAYGTPGLFIVLQNGLGDSIRAYGEVVRASGLPEGRQACLLAARNANGTPGLCMAIQNEHGDAIRAYGEVVRGSGLPLEWQTRLLAAIAIDSTPGLFIALQNGYCGAIHAYSQVVSASGLSPKAQARLLAAVRSSDCTPGLFMALQNGHGEVIRAYGEMVQASGLPSEEQAGLLAARGVGGRPGLLMARQYGHRDAIRAYSEVVRASGLPPEWQDHLLLPRM